MAGSIAARAHTQHSVRRLRTWHLAQADVAWSQPVVTGYVGVLQAQQRERQVVCNSFVDGW